MLIKGIAFFYTIFLASKLGVQGFGLYIVALSYFQLISVISEFGIQRFLIREVAKDESKLSTFLSNVIIFRLTVLLIIFLIFSVFILLSDSDKQRSLLTILAMLAVLPQSIALTLDSALVALQKISLSAIATLLLSISMTILGVIFVMGGLGPKGAVYAIILSQFIYFILLLIFFTKQKLAIFNKPSYSTIKLVIKGSLPYGILGVLGLLYFKIDTLLLSYLKGSYDTGIYGAAYKFLEAIIFIPTAFITAVFPSLAKLHDDSPRQVQTFYFKSLLTLGLLSLFITGAYILILPIVINFFLPQYGMSIPIIRLLSLTIPFMFLNTPAVIVLMSTDKLLKEVIFLSLGTLSFNIVGNLLLIPNLSYFGASIMTIFSEILSFLVFYLLVTRKMFKI